MTLPTALIIMGALYWPATLGLALLAGTLGAYLRGGWRVVCFTAAAIMLATLALGLPLLAEWRSAAPG